MEARLTPEEWIKELAPFDRWNERHFMAMLAVCGMAKDYVDFGSGTGAMVNIARKLGIDAIGIDMLPRDEDWLRIHDLCKPLNLKRRFQLVSSIEVAEHIRQDSDGVYADTVARHVAAGGMLVFTAAHPGQEGEGHVNTRPATYWRKMFTDRGLSYQHERTIRLALIWSYIASPLYWLASNVQIFAAGEPFAP